MSHIGAEVGQKMRSAIKAKLLELNCYVDDELPDYVMVMVANKRSKSQMKGDLELFLTTKTTSFVDWLHIVLKKLKEVTVTNPDVYKKSAKRKADDLPNTIVKKEKKEKKSSSDRKTKTEAPTAPDPAVPGGEIAVKSLTDDLPINANKLAEQRKIIIMKENQANNSADLHQDAFDIPLLSEVNMSTEEELEDLERKIQNVKSRLGLLVDSEEEGEKEEEKDTAEGCVTLKAEPEDLLVEDKKTEKPKKAEKKKKNKTPERTIRVDPQTVEEPIPATIESPPPKPGRAKITFGSEEESATKRRSILERLGKRKSSSTNENDRERDKDEAVEKPKRTKISLSEFRKEEEKILGVSSSSSSSRREDRGARKIGRRQEWRMKESILNRLGVQSKVSVPEKPPEEPEEPPKNREVPSVVKIKPRVIPLDAPQANKTLLLKAVAEAQRSVSQTPKVGTNVKSDAFFTKRYKEKVHEEQLIAAIKPRSLSERQRDVINKILTPVRGGAASSNNNSVATSTGGDLDEQVEEEDEEEEYVPAPIRRVIQEGNDGPKYRPSAKTGSEPTSPEADTATTMKKKHFVVTAEGIVSVKFDRANADKPSIKSRLDRKKSPSPIIFDRSLAQYSATVGGAPGRLGAKSNIPDTLPLVHPPTSVKNREKCRYWPTCRHGDKCEFVHPTASCERFPNCKFGDRCLFLHPVCKFGSSCTRRDCPYTHGQGGKMGVASRIGPSSSGHTAGGGQSLQICRFGPKCSNPACSFFHPKPCKFGKYCKNQRDCTFMHSPFVPHKKSLTWRSH